ncbi:MAG: hypothetical protein PHS31_11050, partial [Victivallaceae bacterium]|nr:hypothetical protein [Victivallaceae bacterium]
NPLPDGVSVDSYNLRNLNSSHALAEKHDSLSPPVFQGLRSDRSGVSDVHANNIHKAIRNARLFIAGLVTCEAYMARFLPSEATARTVT